jgi:hypothetical protein
VHQYFVVGLVTTIGMKKLADIIEAIAILLGLFVVAYLLAKFVHFLLSLLIFR